MPLKIPVKVFQEWLNGGEDGSRMWMIGATILPVGTALALALCTSGKYKPIRQPW